MEGSFELSKSTDGQFYFVLKDGNAETILTSEFYHAMSSAKRASSQSRRTASPMIATKRRNPTTANTSSTSRQPITR